MVMSLSPNQTGDVPTQPQARGLGRNCDFVLLFAAQGSLFMGGGVKTIALALFAYELTGGSCVGVGLRAGIAPGWQTARAEILLALWQA